MGNPSFYSLDFASVINEKIKRIIKWILFAVFVVLVLAVMGGLWFLREYSSETLAKALQDFDFQAADIMRLNENWTITRKRYDPLYPYIASFERIPMTNVVGVFEKLIPQEDSGERSRMKWRSLVVEQGPGEAKPFATLAILVDLGDDDKSYTLARERDYIFQHLEGQVFTNTAAAGGTGQGNVRRLTPVVNLDASQIRQTDSILKGDVKVVIDAPNKATLLFPDVPTNVLEAVSLIEGWQRKIQEYKSETFKDISYAKIIEAGKLVPGFEQSSKYYVDPKKLIGEILRSDFVDSAKKFDIIKLEKEWDKMSLEKNPFRRDKTLSAKALMADVRSIRAVAAGAPQNLQFIATCEKKVDAYYAALSNGVTYANVFTDTSTFTNRVVLPPVQKALPPGRVAVLDGAVIPHFGEGMPADEKGKGGKPKKRSKNGTDDAVLISFPEWSVRVMPERSGEEGPGPNLPRLEMDAVLAALANLEKETTGLWVTGLEVEFETEAGFVFGKWPPVREFTVTGRVPCWHGKRE